jgi:hypothetical protein
MSTGTSTKPAWARHGQAEEWSLDLPGVPIKAEILHSYIARDPQPFWITVTGAGVAIHTESKTRIGAEILAQQILRGIALSIEAGLKAMG